MADAKRPWWASAMLFVGEHLLLLVALGLLIPPYPSMEGEVSPFRRAIPLIVPIMAGSRLCARFLGRESWAGIVVKIAIVLLVGFVMRMRVGMH